MKDFPNFKFFNANAATLLFSLQLGAAGFSGAHLLFCALVCACRLACVYVSTRHEFLRTHGIPAGIAANCYPAVHVWLCAHWKVAEPALVQRVQRFLTLAEMTVAHKYPTCAKIYLSQHKRFEAMRPESRNQSVTFNEEERIRYPVLREEVEILLGELAVRCNN